jgi:hypothetical protein
LPEWFLYTHWSEIILQRDAKQQSSTSGTLLKIEEQWIAEFINACHKMLACSAVLPPLQRNSQVPNDDDVQSLAHAYNTQLDSYMPRTQSFHWHVQSWCLLIFVSLCLSQTNFLQSLINDNKQKMQQKYSLWKTQQHHSRVSTYQHKHFYRTCQLSPKLDRWQQELKNSLSRSHQQPSRASAHQHHSQELAWKLESQNRWTLCCTLAFHITQKWSWTQQVQKFEAVLTVPAAVGAKKKMADLP